MRTICEPALYRKPVFARVSQSPMPRGNIVAERLNPLAPAL